MGIENRPYVGTWQLNNREVIRHTPDCMVYFNGSLEISTCPTCGGRVDLQRFITAVTVDPSTQPVASASVTLHIPRSSETSFFRDGQFLLSTGLEINIYFRGYFPVQGLFQNVTPDQAGGINVQDAVIYPYYHVFHGITVEVSHEYSGGEHTVSLTCNDILHFWNYQKISTSGSFFGGRATNSGVRTNLIGHNFTAMTPYSIIYTLYRSVMGAEGGVGMSVAGNKSNLSANSKSVDKSLWELTTLYWESRFSQHFNNLRMYGMNGTLYNSFQQAFLGRLSTKENQELSWKFADPSVKSKEHDPLQGNAAVSRDVAFDPASTYAGAAAAEVAAKGGLGIDITQMQAFVSDISNWGNVNMFESEYSTKLEIVSSVTDLTGFEFYQDVDGDFVFKPPFYNLDTRANRAYVIKDIDIISISVSDGEPEATVVKATASAFANLAGHGAEGDFGVRSVYVDYRLVAKYGWRQQDIETAYLNNPKAMFYSCVNRLDLYNIGVKKATCSIPLRPELRPGYPVYIEHLDCFFYLQSFSHTFNFGGQCTTSLNLVGRRGKFHAPGKPPQDGRPATVDDIYLSDPWLPPLPLETVGSEGIPRLQGFPNVVMALDTELVNPNAFVVGALSSELSTPEGLQALILKAKEYGVLEIDSENAGDDEREKWLTGPWLIRSSDGTTQRVGSSTDLLAQAQGVQDAFAELQQAKTDVANNIPISTPVLQLMNDLEAARQEAQPLQQIIDAVQATYTGATGDRDTTSNYFSLLLDMKANFNPGDGLPGHYRYYSSAHPNEEQQGMKELVADQETADTTQAAGLIKLDQPTKAIGFQSSTSTLTSPEDAGGGVTVTAGLPIMRPNTGESNVRAVPTPTHQIGTISFAQHRVRKEVTVPRITTQRKIVFPPKALQDVMAPNFFAQAAYMGWGSTIRDYFGALYGDASTTDSFAGIAISVFTDSGLVDVTAATGTLPSFEQALSKVRKDKYAPDSTLDQTSKNATDDLKVISESLAGTLAAWMCQVCKTTYESLVGTWGPPGDTTDPSLNPETKATTFGALSAMWATLARSLAIDYEASPVGSDEEGFKVYVPAYSEVYAYTPVFPVSDGGGYHVIGSYLYGRGLTVDADGGFQQLMSRSPFDQVSVEAAEDFLQAIRYTDENKRVVYVPPGEAFEKLKMTNPSTAAQLATAAAAYLGMDILEVVSDPSLLESAFLNYSSTSKEFSQKVTVVNAAFSLADLGQANAGQVCSCKGAEADTLLAAFSEETYLAVSDETEEVQGWLSAQMAEAGVPWKASQDALRGRVLDMGSSGIADAVERISDSFTSLKGGINNALKPGG